jgi:thioredoxin-like negative regulator of GroEL
MGRIVGDPEAGPEIKLQAARCLALLGQRDRATDLLLELLREDTAEPDLRSEAALLLERYGMPVGCLRSCGQV